MIAQTLPENIAAIVTRAQTLETWNGIEVEEIRLLSDRLTLWISEQNDTRDFCGLDENDPAMIQNQKLIEDVEACLVQIEALIGLIEAEKNTPIFPILLFFFTIGIGSLTLYLTA